MTQSPKKMPNNPKGLSISLTIRVLTAFVVFPFESKVNIDKKGATNKI
jgi:hypothetical protein